MIESIQQRQNDTSTIDKALNDNALNFSTKNSIESQTQIFATSLVKQAKNFHSRYLKELKGLNPESVDFAAKLIYAIPITVFIKSASFPLVVAVSLAGGLKILHCSEEIISKKQKIYLLNAFAIGFFAQLTNFPNVSSGMLLKFPFSMICLLESLILADRLEKTPPPPIKEKNSN